MKRYYAYENWTARAYSAHDVTVHLHECAHCPFDADGRRRGPEPSGAYDCWHRLGIYESLRDAMRQARSLVPKGPEFRKVEEDARKARRAVSRRGLRANGAIGSRNPA